MSDDKTKYKFDFGNHVKLIISYIIEIIENIGAILISWVILMLIGGAIPDGIAKNIILKILSTAFVMMSLILIALIFIPKKVVLADDKILVYRFCIPLQITFWDIRGLNDRIPYSKITFCEKRTKKLYFGANKPFFYVNNDSLVEIRTKHKHYFLPIKDYENFICEVNKRINQQQNKTFV